MRVTFLVKAFWDSPGPQLSKLYPKWPSSPPHLDSSWMWPRANTSCLWFSCCRDVTGCVPPGWRQPFPGWRAWLLPPWASEGTERSTFVTLAKVFWNCSKWCTSCYNLADTSPPSHASRWTLAKCMQEKISFHQSFSRIWISLFGNILQQFKSCLYVMKNFRILSLSLNCCWTLNQKI